ncbi:MAG: hypothetical protein WDW36_000915 [Sanguina aurantia]
MRQNSLASKDISILTDLGAEITGIISPVSVCMAVTVLLVRLLNPDGSASPSSTMVIASIAYSEQDGDSIAEKLSGSLLNAVVFVGIVTCVTFLLVLLFKYRCYKFIYCYLGLGVFNVFFALTGALAIQLLQLADIHMDALSFCFLLFNFSVVGTTGLLFVPLPLLLKQCYLVWTGIITAYMFTRIPEWTTWMLLGAMALYDIVAVLVPRGPLRLLVEMMVERQEDIPGALIYEARPTGRPYQPGRWTDRSVTTAPPPEAADAAADAAPGATTGDLESHPGVMVLAHAPLLGVGGGRVGGSRGPLPVTVQSLEVHRTGSGTGRAPGRMPGGQETDRSPVPCSLPPEGPHPGSVGSSDRGSQEGSPCHTRPTPEQHPLITSSRRRQAPSSTLPNSTLLHRTIKTSPASSSSHRTTDPRQQQHSQGLDVNDTQQQRQQQQLPLLSEATSLLQPGVESSSSQRPSRAQTLQESGGELGGGPGYVRLAVNDEIGADGADGGGGREGVEGGDDDGMLPDAIKLGLGDFIFYSLLVGRAAMYDVMTVFAAYLAIMAGLGLTLVCLAVFQKALPALPFSVALGVMFYFLCRLVLEPFLVPLATHYTYF